MSLCGAVYKLSYACWSCTLYCIKTVVIFTTEEILLCQVEVLCHYNHVEHWAGRDSFRATENHFAGTNGPSFFPEIRFVEVREASTREYAVTHLDAKRDSTRGFQPPSPSFVFCRYASTSLCYYSKTAN